MMRIFDLSQLRPNDRQQMLEIFENTFSYEPGFQYMFGIPEPIKQTRWSAERKFDLYVRRHTYVAIGDPIEAYAWWLRPNDNQAPTLAEQMKVGYWQSPFRFGPAAFKRMYDFSNQEREITNRYVDSNPFWVLDGIATSPSAQGKGYGKQLVQWGLNRAKQDGVQAFVMTHNMRNVRFYEHCGFTLRESEPIRGCDVVAYVLTT